MPDREFFVTTPFAVTADSESGRHWAGRPKELKRIERILRRLSRRNESSLDIIWAKFGAGKSHTLYYLAHRIEQQDDKNLCLVVELPEQARNFLDVYKRIVREIPFEFLGKNILEADHDHLPNDLRRAARAIVHGGQSERDLALQWFSGERPDLRQLRREIGIGSRIETDVAAVDMFSAILKGLNARKVRVCLMLDEFQRIEKLSKRTRSQITSALRSLLSKNPRYFAVFFAISSKIESSALKMVPDELKTIVGVERSVSLPEMDEKEAVQFVQDRLRCFRPPAYSGDEFAPIGRDAVTYGIKAIVSAAKQNLIPRTILQTMGYLYDEIPESCTALDAKTAMEILEDLDWDG